MAWIPAAIGAAGSVIGGMSSGGADEINPREQAEAQLRYGNPDQFTPFGSVRLIKDPGTRKDRHDDTFRQVTNLSPQMQALSQMLMERAGAGRGTFSSGGMQPALAGLYAANMRNRVFGDDKTAHQLLKEGVDLSSYMPTTANYNRPQFGFQGSEKAIGEAPASVYKPPVDAMTNREALDWAMQNTDISPSSADWLGRFFQEAPQAAQSRGFAQGSFDPYDPSHNLADKNRDHIQALISELDALRRPMRTPGEPSGVNWEPAAYNSMMSSVR